VFAERLSAYLAAPKNAPFPDLGPLLRQHDWLAQLDPTPSPASQLLLANGLGMLFIELTDRCNERCIHCYAESSPQCSTMLSREEIERVLEQALTLGKPAVQFTGGDPLLHPELVFAVQTARELGFETLEIYTNGLALNDALLARLSPFSPSFAFSVYSHDAGVHDAITQTSGSLKRTLKAMRRVQQTGLPLRVGIILMAENRGSETETMAFLQQELGLDEAQMGVDVVRSTGRGEFMRDSQPVAGALQQFRHRPDTPQGAENPPPTVAIPPRRGKLCVAANGDVFPCIFSRRLRLGYICNQTLMEVFSALDERSHSLPSAGHWQRCRESLSCSDCQAIAYLLEDEHALA